MKSMKVLMLILVFFGVFMVGCHRHEYVIGRGAEHGPVVYQRWHAHWLLGLVSTDNPLNLSEICPSGHATIVDEVSFANGLVNMLIGFLYSPTTVTIRCLSQRIMDTMARPAAKHG